MSLRIYIYNFLFLIPCFSFDFILEKTEDFAKDKNGNIQLGWAKLLVKEKKIVFPAKYIAMVDEQVQELEVLIANEWGRIHESLFQSDVSALYLSTLCFLLGLKKNDLVNIQVYTKKKNLFPIEDLLLDKRTKMKKKQTGWIFLANEKLMRRTTQAGNIALLYSVSEATVFDCNDPQSKEDWIFSIRKNQRYIKINEQVMIVISKR